MSLVRAFASLALVAAVAAPFHSHAAGELDCTFGTNGIVNRNLASIEAAYDGVLQSTGRIVTLGSGSGALRLTRLLANGAADPSFAGGGTVTHTFTGLEYAGNLARDSQDRLVVSGRVAIDGDTEAFVARFTADGLPDTGFGTGGWMHFDLDASTASFGNEYLSGLAIDAQDRIVVGGSFDANGNIFHPSNANIGVARVTTLGVLDTSFSGDGLAATSSPGTSNDDDVRGLMIDAQGRIVTTGGTSSPNATNSGSRNTIVTRWLPSGAPDTTFDGDGVKVIDMALSGGDDFGIDVAPYAGDRIVLLSSGSDDPLVARLLDDGTPDTSFSGDGFLQRSFLGGQDVTERLLVQADGKLIVTGWPVNGFSFHVASMRFDAAGVLDTTWGGTGVVTTVIAFNERAYTAILDAQQRVVLAGGLDNDTNFFALRYRADGQGAPGTSVAITGVTPSPSLVGEATVVTFSVTDGGGNAVGAGTVTVSDGVDSCTAAASAGSCTLPMNTAGTRTLVAQYTSAGCFAGSTSPPRTHDVQIRITPQAGLGGTISPATPQRVAPGTVVPFVVTALPGYEVQSVTGCGVTPTGNNTWTTLPAFAHCTVTATFRRLSYTLSYAAGANGTLTGATTQVVDHGGSGTPVTAVPDTGYRFTAWSDGVLDNPRTDVDVTAPVAVTALFERLTYVVTPSAGEGGSISPSLPLTVPHGDTATFTVAATPTHRIATVAGCGGTRTGTSFTTAPITAACAVTATFDRNPVAQAGTLSVREDTPTDGQLVGNDDGPALQFAIGTPPARGTVQLLDAATGAYRYTPPANGVGTDTFSFRVADAEVTSADATVTVTISPVNDAPSLSFAAAPTHGPGTSGAQARAAFAQFDAGPADEDATQAASAYPIELVDDPAGILVPGSVAIATDGTLTYALAGTGGVATVTARVRDDGGVVDGGIDLSAPQAFTITVARGADLAVAIDNDRAGLLDGDAVVYRLVVDNDGPDAVTGAALATTLSPKLVGVTWQCVAATSTATCPTPASGSGAPAMLIDLPAGTQLRFEILATVGGTIGAFVTAGVSIAAPDGVASLDPSNDAASDTDPIVTEGVFVNGFEGASRPVPDRSGAR